MNHILANFLKENLNRNIKLFINNGFQLNGQLIDYDESHLLLLTTVYGGSQKVPVTISAITTYVSA